MWLRWTRRGAWTALLLILVVAPARIAQSPQQVQARMVDASTTAAAGGVGTSAAVAWTILGLMVLTVPALIVLRRRSPRA